MDEESKKNSNAIEKDFINNNNNNNACENGETSQANDLNGAISSMSKKIVTYLIPRLRDCATGKVNIY